MSRRRSGRSSAGWRFVSGHAATFTGWTANVERRTQERRAAGRVRRRCAATPSSIANFTFPKAGQSLAQDLLRIGSEKRMNSRLGLRRLAFVQDRWFSTRSAGASFDWRSEQPGILLHVRSAGHAADSADRDRRQPLGNPRMLRPGEAARRPLLVRASSVARLVSARHARDARSRGTSR